METRGILDAYPCLSCQKIVCFPLGFDVAKFLTGEIDVPEHKGHVANRLSVLTVNLLQSAGVYTEWPVEEAE